MRELFECINEYPFINMVIAIWISINIGIIFNKD